MVEPWLNCSWTLNHGRTIIIGSWFIYRSRYFNILSDKDLLNFFIEFHSCTVCLKKKNYYSQQLRQRRRTIVVEWWIYTSAVGAAYYMDATVVPMSSSCLWHLLRQVEDSIGSRRISLEDFDYLLSLHREGITGQTRYRLPIPADISLAITLWHLAAERSCRCALQFIVQNKFCFHNFEALLEVLANCCVDLTTTLRSQYRRPIEQSATSVCCCNCMRLSST